jgi:hypothetical protein
MDNPNLSDEDKKLLNKMRPEEHKKFQFFASPDDNEDKSWIKKNYWWILIILGALLVSLIRH